MAPTVRSFSAEFEPLRLIGRYPERYPGWLESSAPSGGVGHDPAGAPRFDVLPISTGESLRLDAAGRLVGPHAQGAGGFLEALDAWWRSLARANGEVSLPFSGGWLLYLGYELAAEIEPRLVLPGAPDPWIALAWRTPAAWIRERGSGRAWVIAEPGHERLLEEFAAQVQALPAAQPTPPPVQLDIEEEPPTFFLEAVTRALGYIAAGDIYQANLSRGWAARARESIDPVELYRRLRAANPAPFSALLRCADFAIVSSSPERLVSVRDGRAATRPIAGTRPRGATAERDAALIASLLDNEKERAEHVMLIDLERNDLGRVCAGGSVRVDEYMSVETYAHVHHIVSNVSGRLRADATPVQVIRAMFPGGTITGCPKVRCMQIIAQLEAAGRGAYTGSIGYLNLDGGLDLNILIRTITARSETLRFRAGAGIVADSVPAQELAETRAKAEGLLRALRTP